MQAFINKQVCAVCCGSYSYFGGEQPTIKCNAHLLALLPFPWEVLECRGEDE